MNAAPMKERAGAIMESVNQGATMAWQVDGLLRAAGYSWDIGKF
jgi:hypothetical protein